MFMVCYIRENPEDAGNQKERYDRFQAMSRSDKQKILQNAFYHYLVSNLDMLIVLLVNV